MDYTLSRYVTVCPTIGNKFEQSGKQSCVRDTIAIAHISVFLYCAASACPQLPFLPQYNDTTIAESYTAKVSATKSLCITMGFCNAGRYASELSGVPQQVGERL